LSSNIISITLEFDQAQYKAKDAQLLRFTLNNDSNKNVSILKWHTPLDGFNNDMFRVEKEGKQAVYLGKVIKRGRPEIDDYIMLGPKESESLEFDLTQVYDINEAGDYTVTYKSYFLDIGEEEPHSIAKKSGFSPQKASSNVAGFKLLERREPMQMKGVSIKYIASLEKAAEKPIPAFKNCTKNQEEILRRALREAAQITSTAKLVLLGALDDERPAAERFKTWFGNYDNERYNKVASNYGSIWDALANKNITFSCDCTKKAYAYVYPTRPYEIFLCKDFWSAPLTGTDSQAGTLVHEVSHFNVVIGTEDYIYGQSGCRELAENNPKKAINNADSHEYFAENNPSLDTGRSTPVYANLLAANGQYVVAEGGGGGEVNANRNEAKTWETFILIDIAGQPLKSGDRVHLQTYDGAHYVVAEGGGGREIKADRTSPRSWETFVINKTAGTGEIKYGDKISLQAFNGNYVVAEGGGGGKVNANRSQVSDWETFRLYSLPLAGTLPIHLKAFKGQYVVAEGGGGSAVNANRNEAKTWETFILIDIDGLPLKSGDRVHLQTYDGAHYVVAEGGGGREIKADRTSPRSWETFVINKISGTGEIKNGDKISLQAFNGNYVVAEGGGGGEVNANRPQRGDWETFTIEFDQ